MTPEQEAEIDWSLCTWEGSRIQQHNEFRALSAQEKLRQMDELCRLTDFLLEQGRHARAKIAAAGGNASE